MSYQEIFPPSSLPDNIQSQLDTQPFEIYLSNPTHRMNEITGITNSRYHRMGDVVSGFVVNTFNRLN